MADGTYRYFWIRHPAITELDERDLEGGDGFWMVGQTYPSPRRTWYARVHPDDADPAITHCASEEEAMEWIVEKLGIDAGDIDPVMVTISFTDRNGGEDQ